MNTPEPAQSPSSEDPANSTLLALARQAFETIGPESTPEWPQLNFDDPAQRAFGDYELLEEIGRGGMGVVYRARQRSLDREVAIKFIADHLADTASIARFFSEARAAARLNHPNIVPVYEVSQVETIHYFSMPLLSGETLADKLNKGVMDLDEALSMMLKLCEAIHYAHRLRLLHLDLKPANILIDERGEPMIADFGLARRMDAEGGVDAQEVSGTPNFMAPEQILIKQYRMTAATDIYALGAMLYHALVGQSPHGQGKADELMQRAVAGRIKHLSEHDAKISADLAAVTMKCLQLLQGDRYHSIADFAEDLRCIRDGHPVSVRKPRPWERLRLWVKREPRFAAAATFAAIALCSGTIATAAQWNVAAEQRDTAVTQRDIAIQQQQLAEGMAALGSWLYAQQAEIQIDKNESAEDFTKRMVEWLSQRYPNNEDLQAEVLSAFAKGVIAAGGDPGNLMIAVIQVLGREYRQQMIDALTAGSAANRYAMAARLAWYDEHTGSNPEQFRALMDSAIATQPDSAEVWKIAAVYCAKDKESLNCLYPQAAEKLVELEPENAYSWLLRVDQLDQDEARTVLHEAAQRRFFDDGYRATVDAYLQTVKTARVPVPKLLSATAKVFDPDISPEFVVAAAETQSFPLARWYSLTHRCDPKNKFFSDARVYEDCKTVGETMARGDGSLLSNMIGVVIVRRLAKGTALEDEMIGLRRNYIYATETTRALSISRVLSYSWEDFHQDMMNLGELQAWQNRLAHLGVPPLPPVDWQPANPLALLLPAERKHYLEKNPNSKARWP